jgi:hypothetical protein
VKRTDERAPVDQAPAETDGLDQDELAKEAAVDLPDREAMTTLRGFPGMDIDNFAMPINEAEATNINTTDSYAIADADQIVILDQLTDESAE